MLFFKSRGWITYWTDQQQVAWAGGHKGAQFQFKQEALAISITFQHVLVACPNVVTNLVVMFRLVAGDTSEGGHRHATAPGRAAALRAPQRQVHHLGKYRFSEHVQHLPF